MDWKSLMLGNEDWSFLPETVFRTMVMFLIIVTGLRFLGKRGITELSVFELGVIIGLGSAAGDPMFYQDVGILPGLIVFIIVLGLYKLLTFLISRSNRFERVMEGKPHTIIENGKILLDNFRREPLALDELFSKLRTGSVSHLGQVRLVIMEPDGDLSIFYQSDDHVLSGLPILPDLYNRQLHQIGMEGTYACVHCGNVEHLGEGIASCGRCEKTCWVAAIDDKRIK